MINPSSTSSSPSCYCLAPTFLFFYFIFRSSVFHTPDMENFTVNYHLKSIFVSFFFPEVLSADHVGIPDMLYLELPLFLEVQCG